MEMRFFRCKECGKIIAIVDGPAHCPTKCCGEPMEEIVPNTSDGAAEKHVPVIKVNGNHVVVEVGSVAHPMLDVHYIEWIALETDRGNQRKQLKPGDAPRAEFALLDGEKVVAAYAYCNLHSLFKA